MPHLPLLVWIVLGVIPVVVALVLVVEAKVVRPSLDEERPGRKRLDAKQPD
jgi:hypothetical protein